MAEGDRDEWFDRPLGWVRFDADFTDTMGRRAIFDGPVADFGRWAKLVVVLARVEGHEARLDDEATCSYVMRCLEVPDRQSLAAFVARMESLGLVSYERETCKLTERQVNESASFMASKRRAASRGGAVKKSLQSGKAPVGNLPDASTASSTACGTAPSTASRMLQANVKPITITRTVTRTEERKGHCRAPRDRVPEDGARDVAERVVARLNERAHRSFRPGSDKTVSAVRARLREGYTEEQLMHVVDVKCAEWSGTDMERYLRPETLFAPSHIESYVNQPMPAARADPAGTFGIEGEDPWAMPMGGGRP